MPRTGLGSQSPNHREALTAISSITGNSEYVYSTNHTLQVNAVITPGGLPSTFVNGQSSVGVVAAALAANALQEGVIIQALSTNTVSIFIGKVGVTTSTGFELQPGQATSIAVDNTNTIYAISGSASQGLCFVGS